MTEHGEGELMATGRKEKNSSASFTSPRFALEELTLGLLPDYLANDDRWS